MGGISHVAVGRGLGRARSPQRSSFELANSVEMGHATHDACMARMAMGHARIASLVMSLVCPQASDQSAYLGLVRPEHLATRLGQVGVRLRR